MNWRKTTEMLKFSLDVEHLHFGFEVFFTALSTSQLSIDGFAKARCPF